MAFRFINCEAFFFPRGFSFFFTYWMKNYKFKIYKRYKDEIWGKLVLSNTFSYNKKSILLNYKSKIMYNNLRFVSKYNYYRKGFLKRLRSFTFLFKTVRKRRRLLNFSFKKTLLRVKPNKSKRTKKARFVRFTSKMAGNRRFSRNRGWRFNRFRRVKSNLLSKSVYQSSVRSFFKKNASNLLFANFFALSVTNKIIFKRKLGGRKHDVFFKFSLNSYCFGNKRRLAFKKGYVFFKKNSLKFLLKKKLNLRYSKSFFYSVHVSSPRKKQKRWSLYGLRLIYYRKVALFYGFSNVQSFLKFCTNASRWKKCSEIGSNVLLEARLESFLIRTNLFCSIYFIKKFIEFGNVFVNNKKVNSPHFILGCGEIVSFNRKYFKLLYLTLKSNLKNKKVLLNAPGFMEVDYKLLIGMLIRFPNYLSLTKPVSFDLYTKNLTFHR